LAFPDQQLPSKGGTAMFDKERFIEDCRGALRERDAQHAIRELVAKAVSDPAALMRGLGEPARAGIDTLYRADDLAILNLCWGPRMQFRPHDHRMWAVIGIYSGRERNIFYRRSEGRVAQQGAKELQVKDTIPLGESIIHAVTNPLDQVTAAIHVYGGDFFAAPRSEWDPATLEERPYDVARTIREFEAANERYTGALSR
jgi:predicted metal-dependent enzyme (double-stranded beta helix superfamily)